MLLALVHVFRVLSELNGDDSLSGGLNAFPYGGNDLMFDFFSVVKFLNFWYVFLYSFSFL